jgi:hypothetical protein
MVHLLATLSSTLLIQLMIFKRQYVLQLAQRLLAALYHVLQTALCLLVRPLKISPFMLHKQVLCVETESDLEFLNI